VRDAKFPRGDSDLKDQARRASRGAGLNLAEGVYREGEARLYHFRGAASSASEWCSALDFVVLPGVDKQQAKLRRVVAMIGKLR
jgi:four helix bundle protein